MSCVVVGAWSDRKTLRSTQRTPPTERSRPSGTDTAAIMPSAKFGAAPLSREQADLGERTLQAQLQARRWARAVDAPGSRAGGEGRQPRDQEAEERQGRRVQPRQARYIYIDIDVTLHSNEL